jgi:hypothetical protein
MDTIVDPAAIASMRFSSGVWGGLATIIAVKAHRRSHGAEVFSVAFPEWHNLRKSGVIHLPHDGVEAA